MQVDQQVLHMNGGVGKTSYKTNSLLQRAAISMVKPIVKASIEQLSFLHDLPGNDFNTLFRSLPGFYKKLEEEQLGPCFITAMPGSFYGRLFPNNSLHFVHSSYALLWISEGLNKKNIYIAKTSPPDVYKQYLEQFKKDFRVFLRSQAEELVPGGSMIFTTLGSTKSHDPLSIWEVGLIEEEKLDTFNMPLYFPTTKEAEDVIEAEGFFTLQSLEVFKNDWDSYIKHADSGLDKKARAAPILATQFGEVAMDNLFRRFEEDVLDHMEMEN
ncbi:unnamed protein product [Malus baccata var. baccata]